jgi:hypothetical protein
MLVSFGLDAETMAEKGPLSPLEWKRQHIEVLNLWRRLGILIHEGDILAQSCLVEAIKSLSPDVRKLWQEALAKFPTRGAHGWDGSIRSTSSNKLKELCNVAQVGFVDDVIAEVDFGVADGQFCSALGHLDGFEVCRMSSASQSVTFARSQLLSQQSIESGAVVADLWRQRFLAFVKHGGKHIGVVDRYAVQEFWNAGPGIVSGLERVLRNIGNDADHTKYVTIFSSWTEALQRLTLDDIAVPIRAVIDHVAPHKLGKVTLWMLPAHDFGRICHHRFIRFGEHAWELDVGLEVLCGTTVRRPSTASLKNCSDVKRFREAEDDLKRAKSAKSVQIFP